MKTDRVLLGDVVLACVRIQEFLTDVSKDHFLRSLLIQSAVIRQIEIIGEAVKRLSSDFRTRHPAIPWKEISGMRDRLIHGYDDVDIDIVWDTAASQIPKLLTELQPDMDEAIEP